MEIYRKMSENLILDVATREVTGKQVKALRREGYVPGVIYGPTEEQPIAVQVPWAALRPVLQQAGGTSLINLNLGNKTVNVLVKTVQRHPVRRDVLHVDFYAVDVNVPIKLRIPVVVPNREAVAKRLAARLFQPVTSIEVQSLPTDIPSEIPVDLSSVKRAGQHITVADLPALKGVTYLADDSLVVVRVVSLTSIDLETGEEIFDDTPVNFDDVQVIAKGKEEEEEF
jgi:large subunit ribosomal protein L25